MKTRIIYSLSECLLFKRDIVWAIVFVNIISLLLVFKVNLILEFSYEFNMCISLEIKRQQVFLFSKIYSVFNLHSVFCIQQLFIGSLTLPIWQWILGNFPRNYKKFRKNIYISMKICWEYQGHIVSIYPCRIADSPHRQYFISVRLNFCHDPATYYCVNDVLLELSTDYFWDLFEQ